MTCSIRWIETMVCDGVSRPSVQTSASRTLRPEAAIAFCTIAFHDPGRCSGRMCNAANEKEFVMPQTYLEMAKDLVLEQIHVRRVEAHEVIPLMEATYRTLAHLDQAQSPTASVSAAPPDDSALPANWRTSIQRKSVTCLVCGDTFKQLSARHLSKHDLNPRSYRHQFGIPLTQALSARTVTTRRRALAKEIQPWKLTHRGAKAAKKGSGGTGAQSRGWTNAVVSGGDMLSLSPPEATPGGRWPPGITAWDAYSELEGLAHRRTV